MITCTTSGAVEASDIKTMIIERSGADFVARVTYEVDLGGRTEVRAASWTLTAAQKAAIAADFLDSAKAAIAAHAGL